VTDGFMGPPWQMDWRLDALAVLEVLPARARDMVYAARAELVTAKDPYFRGVEADADLPDGMWVLPVRSSAPHGARALFFDDGCGWLKYTFVPRSEDPQITAEQLFWQGFERDEAVPAEE
jgi:hypothetical protein